MTERLIDQRNEPGCIPIAEQAAALLKGQTFELAAKYCGGDLRQLDERWTVKIADLLRYVEENGIDNSWLRTRPESFDGIYFVSSEASWLVYEQERGRIYDESRRSFASYDEALGYVLQNYFMPKLGSFNASDFNQDVE